ncbi:MAG: ribonuclease P protein component [Bacteroidetes bacterium]|nr:ribonuclease P protein component [Bacteroidota bacterium]
MRSFSNTFASVSIQQPIHRHTFRKAERLCSKKLITDVFEKGHSFYIKPFKTLWIDTTLSTSAPVQLLITVPKRYIRDSWQRNSIKRLIREAYRLNKDPFYSILQQKQKQCALAIVYTGRKIITATEAESAIILILCRLSEEYEKITG